MAGMKHILQMEPNTTSSMLLTGYIMFLTCELFFVVFSMCSLKSHSFHFQYVMDFYELIELTRSDT